MIKDHYETVKQTIQNKAVLCTVTKRRSLEEIMEFYNAGERVFGENRAQDLVSRAAALPKDIEWQFIGHLQRNKVKEILPIVSRIQSLDNLALANVIEKEAAKAGLTVSVLAEFHLAEEDTNKTGLSADEAFSFVKEVMKLEHIRLEGMMVMGPHTDDEERIREVFTEAHDLFVSLRKEFGEETFHVLSMGMSDDYRIAVECGSTMVRIGTYLFEE
ncbi:MAG: YggS family pyridoxal phosphate-dependent enzyme [Solobacterium sp.]|nr:YggS family pyridoxal phosphate-dependent enzyme [Solobacterium sp.]